LAVQSIPQNGKAVRQIDIYLVDEGFQRFPQVRHLSFSEALAPPAFDDGE